MANNLMLRLVRGAAILSATLGAAAIAQPDQQINVDAAGRDLAPKTRVVSTSGFDLAKPADRQAIDRRIKVAAGAVCEVFDVSADRHATDYSRCYEAALSGARAQLSGRAARNDTGAITVSAG